MTIQTAVITPRRITVETVEHVNFETIGRLFKRKQEIVIHTPDWDKMKDFPQEAIEYFKSKMKKDGTIYWNIDWNENPEKAQNDFFNKNHITKSNLIKLEDEKCNYDKSIKVTWDDGN